MDKSTVQQFVDFIERKFHRKAVHWTDKHIALSPTGSFVAFDEAGLEHGVFDRYEDAVDSLVEHGRVLEGGRPAVPGHTEECEIDGVHYVVMAGNRSECLASLITEEQ